MSDYQLRNGQGSAFPEIKTKETQPDFQGEIVTPTGERLEISMWKKQMRNGADWFSISIKEPFKKEEAPSVTPLKTNPEEDDLPFD